MYTTQTGRIQIFDQLSAHFIKTASFSMAKSFVKYCLVYSARKYNIWSLLEWQKMLAFSGCSVYLALQGAVCSSRNTTHGHFRGVEEGENAKMLDYWTGIPKATTTIKIVIPLVTFFFLAKIQIIYSFTNSFVRAGWLVRSVRGGVDITFYENSISTYWWR